MAKTTKKKATKRRKAQGRSTQAKTEADALKVQLSKIILPWDIDGCLPNNYVRTNGDETVVAVVDRWCGGFQDPHKPAMIGWKVTKGNQSHRNIVLVNTHLTGDVDEAIELSIEDAKQQADVEFMKFMGVAQPEEEKPICPECGCHCSGCGPSLEMRQVELWVAHEDGTWDCGHMVAVPRELGMNEQEVIRWVDENNNIHIPDGTQFFGVYYWGSDDA
jgi:hypothetical protein